MTNKEYCRSGRHAWVEENIYRAPGGTTKYCYPCSRERKGQRAQAVAEGREPVRAPAGPRRLSQKQIDTLRSMLGCVVCHQTPQSDGWIRHLAGCTVPLNVEGAPQRRGRPPRVRPEVLSGPGAQGFPAVGLDAEGSTWDRRCIVCEKPIPPPPEDMSGNRGATRNRKICSDECRKARRAGAVRTKRAGQRSVA